MRAFKRGVARREKVLVVQSAADTDAPVRWQFRDTQAQPDVACLLYSMSIRKRQAQFSNSAIVTATWNPYVFHLLGETYTIDADFLVDTHWAQQVQTSTAVGINARSVTGDLIEAFDWAMSPNTPKVLTGDRLEFGLTTTATGLSNMVEFEFEYELVTMGIGERLQLMKRDFG